MNRDLQRVHFLPGLFGLRFPGPATGPVVRESSGYIQTILSAQYTPFEIRSPFRPKLQAGMEVARTVSAHLFARYLSILQRRMIEFMRTNPALVVELCKSGEELLRKYR